MNIEDIAVKIPIKGFNILTIILIIHLLNCLLFYNMAFLHQNSTKKAKYALI